WDAAGSAVPPATARSRSGIVTLPARLGAFSRPACGARSGATRPASGAAKRVRRTRTSDALFTFPFRANSQANGDPSTFCRSMHIELASESDFHLRTLCASDELKISALPNGCIYAIECKEILINQVLASPLAGGIHQAYLRVHGRTGIRFTEIIGPRATNHFASASDRLVWSGSWEGLEYRCTCWLHATGGGWFFHLELKNQTSNAIRCDAVMMQDVGLATRA